MAMHLERRKMDSKIENIIQKIEELRSEINELSGEELKEYGSMALELVGDYPLYGAMSNISYDEAILIELILGEEVFKKGE